MFNKILKINLIIIFFASILFAEVINDIKVVGNKRISKESIIVFGKIVIGENYSQNNLNTVLKSIYETNFFSEVNLDIKNSILLITVNENPIIESVELNGIKNNKLNEFIKEKIILKERKSFIQSSLTADLNLIKNIVKSSGYYFAKINTRSTLNEDQNSIELIYDIDLGKKAEINQIQFLGDKKIKDKKLKNVITSEESKFWKFLSQAKYLNYDQIALDKRLLINFYKNNGYYNVKVSNSFVEFKNNGSFKLIYNIDAGNIFKFKTLSLDLSDDYDKKYFINIDNAIKKLENK
jgi:outer membrane protein insertion porin family